MLTMYLMVLIQFSYNVVSIMGFVSQQLTMRVPDLLMLLLVKKVLQEQMCLSMQERKVVLLVKLERVFPFVI